jgi:hypothetical protein
MLLRDHDESLSMTSDTPVVGVDIASPIVTSDLLLRFAVVCDCRVFLGPRKTSSGSSNQIVVALGPCTPRTPSLNVVRCLGRMDLEVLRGFMSAIIGDLIGSLSAMLSIFTVLLSLESGQRRGSVYW